MPPDKRRWTTPAQADFLLAYFPEYVEAQTKRRYDKFWPKFFQQWFINFPPREPGPDDKTDSEPEPDSESDPENSDDESAASLGKRKRKATKKKKRVKKVSDGLKITWRAAN
jgi:hypothetical protein